jgi:putative pyruvate formate lyase activating enzyme
MLPTYISLFENGKLESLADKLYSSLSKCEICPRKCAVNRLDGEEGFCHSGKLPIVSSYCVHYGEEPPLVGGRGVGNIFLGNCNLRCVYCQNYQISQNYFEEKKHEITFDRLADIMLELQNENVNSIGFVSPTHFLPQILVALNIAVGRGLKIPIIYNSNGYDSIEVLKLIEGVFDIYLPDFKYGDNEFAIEYSIGKDYICIAIEAIKEMYRQVGSKLIFAGDGVAKGLIIRHLVLPNNISDTFSVLKKIKETIGNDVFLSIMSQYYPTFKAEEHVLISREIRESEYLKVADMLDELGFENGWLQEYESKSVYKPDFNDRIFPFIKVK